MKDHEKHWALKHRLNDLTLVLRPSVEPAALCSHSSGLTSVKFWAEIYYRRIKTTSKGGFALMFY